MGTLVVVTLVLAWAGEDGTAAGEDTVVTGGVVEPLSDVVRLAVGAVLGLDGPA